MAQVPIDRDRGSPNITHAMQTLEFKKQIAMALLTQMEEEEEDEEEETEAEGLRFQSLLLLMQQLELEESLLVFSP